MKYKNLKRLFSGGLVLIATMGFMNAQTPDPSTTPGQQQTPSPYPVPPSPVVSPNQIPQNPTIPKLTIPINAPTDSVFRKIDDEDKPFKLQRLDTTRDSLPTPRK